MLRRRLIYCVLIVFSLVLLNSCGGEEEESTVRLKRPARPAVKKVETAKELSRSVSTYLSAPRRNPFRSYLAEQAQEAERIKTPLECCDIRVFKLLAVVSGIDEPRALVLAPDGKRYTVKKGDLIGTREGRIVEFSEKSIIVEEVVRDISGRVMSRPRIELSLPTKGAG